MRFVKRNKSPLAVLLICAFLGITLVGTSIYIHNANAAATDALTPKIHWVQKFEAFGGIADQTVKTGDVLAMNYKTSRISLADSNTGASTYVIGAAGNNASQGQPVEVVRSGILTGLFVPQAASTGLTPYGAPLYLSTSEGGVTTYANWGAGVTLIVGTVLPQSQRAQVSGVTAGSDTILFAAPASGVSPYGVQSQNETGSIGNFFAWLKTILHLS